MSHVEFKKCPCCRVDFEGLGPLSYIMKDDNLNNTISMGSAQIILQYINGYYLCPSHISCAFIGALDGGSPMSHVDFRNWPCRPVKFKVQAPFYSISGFNNLGYHKHNKLEINAIRPVIQALQEHSVLCCSM